MLWVTSYSGLARNSNESLLVHCHLIGNLLTTSTEDRQLKNRLQDECFYLCSWKPEQAFQHQRGGNGWYSSGIPWPIHQVRLGMLCKMFLCGYWRQRLPWGGTHGELQCIKVITQRFKGFLWKSKNEGTRRYSRNAKDLRVVRHKGHTVLRRTSVRQSTYKSLYN